MGEGRVWSLDVQNYQKRESEVRQRLRTELHKETFILHMQDLVFYLHLRDGGEEDDDDDNDGRR